MGNVSRWIKDREFIFQEAGKAESARLLGYVYKRKQPLMKRSIKSLQQEKMDDRLLDMCTRRNKERRPLSIKFVGRCATHYIKHLAELGFEVKWRGQPLVVSRSWCYRWLIANGFVSRLRTNKRNHSPEVMEIAIGKFIKAQDPGCMRILRIR
jgi:hypothetical protein